MITSEDFFCLSFHNKLNKRTKIFSHSQSTKAHMRMGLKYTTEPQAKSIGHNCFELKLHFLRQKGDRYFQDKSAVGSKELHDCQSGAPVQPCFPFHYQLLILRRLSFASCTLLCDFWTIPVEVKHRDWIFLFSSESVMDDTNAASLYHRLLEQKNALKVMSVEK